MSDGPPRTPPRPLRWWEGLPLALQVAIVAPLAIGLLTLLHVTVLNQPMGRGTSYGLFWGVLATLLIVGSTRMERSRREAQAEREHPGGDKGRLRL